MEWNGISMKVKKGSNLKKKQVKVKILEESIPLSKESNALNARQSKQKIQYYCKRVYYWY